MEACKYVNLIFQQSYLFKGNEFHAKNAIQLIIKIRIYRTKERNKSE